MNIKFKSHGISSNFQACPRYTHVRNGNCSKVYCTCTGIALCTGKALYVAVFNKIGKDGFKTEKIYEKEKKLPGQ